MVDRSEDRPPPEAERANEGAPAWVRFLLIGLALAAVVVIITMVLLGGEHGPGRH